MTDDANLLPLGKLAPPFLHELITKYTTADESIIIGPQIGMDATVISHGDNYLIAKTDPITFVVDNIGYYAVNINANDIACLGGVPKWFLCTLLLPEAVTGEAIVRNIFSQINKACQELGISFCGGHTEVTHGLNRPILIGQMLGEVEKQKLVNNKNAEAGDDILLTKGIAIEATSVIAREKGQQLIDFFPDELIERCKNFIYEPGISVLKEAHLAVAIGGVKAMHDPTEGGLATGLHELANCTGCGLKIVYKDIPLLAEAKLLCDQFELNILGVIASGALLIISEKHATAKIIKALKENNINVKNIGKLTDPQFGIKILVDEEEINLPEFYQDEITKLFV